MRISEQLNVIESALNAWATPKGGSASVVSNMADLWKQAELSSQKPRILICYVGRQRHGSFANGSILGVSNRTFNVAFTRGRGYASNRGDTLTQTVGSIDPFYDDLEDAEKVLREIPGISQDVPVDWGGDKYMRSPSGMVVDGYMATISTMNDEI